MAPTADVLALATAEYDIGGIPRGTTQTVKWRGKPVFIRHRTPAEIEREASVDIATLRKPELDSDRAINSEW